MLQLYVGLSLPRHYLEGLVPPEDNLLNWNGLTTAQGFMAFQMSTCDTHGIWDSQNYLLLSDK